MLFAMMWKHREVIFSGGTLPLQLGFPEVTESCALISFPEIPPLKVMGLNYDFKLVTVTTPKRAFQEKPLSDSVIVGMPS